MPWTLSGSRKSIKLLLPFGVARLSFWSRRKMKTMKNAQGACICGFVRYEIVAEPITLFACHYTDCQTVTGSGFVLALRVPYRGVTVIQGEAKAYERTEADERKRIIHRCPHCLTVLWSERPDSKEYVT